MTPDDAITKTCPLKASNCYVGRCMGWEWWPQTFTRIKDGKVVLMIPESAKQSDFMKNPREGDCGMKPPALECNYEQ